MMSFIITFFVGLICIILGYQNIKGNISSLHSYHRSRVSEEDILPFGKMVGTGTIIIGVSLIIFNIFSAVSALKDNDIFFTIGTVIMILGLVIGLIISFYAMIKYNKGIF